MVKEYLKKNFEKLITIIVTILVALITDEIFNSSVILKDIIDNGISIKRIFIWLFQGTIIATLSILFNYFVDRMMKNSMRKNIQFKKINPFKNTSRQDKQEQIENKIKKINGYSLELYGKFDQYDLDKKIYLCKQHLYCLQDLVVILNNLTYYKQTCITKKEEHPVNSKFSIMDMKFFIVSAENSYKQLCKHIDDIKSSKPHEVYELNELKYFDGFMGDIHKTLIQMKKDLSI